MTATGVWIGEIAGVQAGIPLGGFRSNGREADSNKLGTTATAEGMQADRQIRLVR